MANANNILVFYHYFEANSQYRDNLIYFLSTAYRHDLDFIIIIAGSCSIKLPNRPNIKYFHTENNNLDYGGYAAAINNNLNTIQQYDYFIFINCSTRGPFLPSFINYKWSDAFLSFLQDDVHLVGTAINILASDHLLAKKFSAKYPYPSPYSHVQTNAYALTALAIKHLLDIGFYDAEPMSNKDDVVAVYEIRLSQEIKKCGWNIKCFLPDYNSIDYRQSHYDINLTSYNGDPLNARAYFGRTLHALEQVFIKTNRNLLTNIDLISLSLSTLKYQKQLAITECWLEYADLVARLTAQLQVELEKEHTLKVKLLRKAQKKINKIIK